MKDPAQKKLPITALVTMALLACSRESDNARQDAHLEKQGHIEKHDDDEVHKHGRNETSDLDRSVSDLFAATCEHDIKTHECDECRYEVGVVKAPANLFDGGLMKSVKAKKQVVIVPLSLTGEVRFDERRVTHVSTQAEGIIRKVHVMLGGKVKNSVIEKKGNTTADAIGARGATYPK